MSIPVPLTLTTAGSGTWAMGGHYKRRPKGFNRPWTRWDDTSESDPGEASCGTTPHPLADLQHEAFVASPAITSGGPEASGGSAFAPTSARFMRLAGYAAKAHPVD